MAGLPVHHQLPEFTQAHVHRVSDHPAISSSGDLINKNDFLVAQTVKRLPTVLETRV